MDALTSPGPERLPPDLWQELADQLPQLAWVTDGDGQALWFNKRALDYLGLSLAEVVGTGWTSSIHPAALPQVAATWDRAVESQTTYECQYPLRRHDGQWRHFLARAEPHRNSQGEMTYWFGTSTDVTDQVAAERHHRYLLHMEEVLRASGSVAEAQSAAIQHLGKELGASRVFFTDPDPDRRKAHVSEEYRAPDVVSLVGVHHFSEPVFTLYTRGEPVVTADFSEHEAFAQDRQRLVDAHSSSCAFLDVPLVREGKLVSVLSVHQAERREWTEQEVALAVATAERSWSLIERTKAEQQARAAAEELETMYATAPIGLTVIDADTRYVRIN
jgi:PAS domain S-box-containing protein